MLEYYSIRPWHLPFKSFLIDQSSYHPNFLVSVLKPLSSKRHFYFTLLHMSFYCSVAVSTKPTSIFVRRKVVENRGNFHLTSRYVPYSIIARKHLIVSHLQRIDPKKSFDSRSCLLTDGLDLNVIECKYWNATNHPELVLIFPITNLQPEDFKILEECFLVRCDAV
jgi:hypothetical protein